MICKKCGREYQRQECEYCAREQKWDNSLSKKQVMNIFTPRIRKDLENEYYEPYKIQRLYTKLFKNDKWYSVFMFGASGSGKTLLSAELTLQFARVYYVNNKKQPKCLFITVPDLLKEIRNSFSNKTEVTELDIIDKYSNCDWLILDDLGVEKTSEWSLQTLYLIINYRYEHLKYTIFTSNLSLDEFAEKIGEDRISSRIAGMAKTMHLKDHDFRLKGVE